MSDDQEHSKNVKRKCQKGKTENESSVMRKCRKICREDTVVFQTFAVFLRRFLRNPQQRVSKDVSQSIELRYRETFHQSRKRLRSACGISKLKTTESTKKPEEVK